MYLAMVVVRESIDAFLGCTRHDEPRSHMTWRDQDKTDQTGQIFFNIVRFLYIYIYMFI
jgi:hypothetical protein